MATTVPYRLATSESMPSTYTLLPRLSGSRASVLVSSVMDARWAASPAATKSALPTICLARSTST
ncbi:MAG: hypothetical protein R2742_12950 [Micropruina glycogenica]